jgi:hypothetical protein
MNESLARGSAPCRLPAPGSILAEAHHLQKVAMPTGPLFRMVDGNFLQIASKPLPARMAKWARHPIRCARPSARYAAVGTAGAMERVYKVAKAGSSYCVKVPVIQSAALSKQKKYIFRWLYRAKCAEHLSSQLGLQNGRVVKASLIPYPHKSICT